MIMDIKYYKRRIEKLNTYLTIAREPEYIEMLQKEKEFNLRQIQLVRLAQIISARAMMIRMN